MDNNNVDNVSGMGYDTSNDVNDFVVKMDEQRPLHDAECKHKQLRANPKDTIGDAVYHECITSPGCPVGFYIQPK